MQRKIVVTVSILLTVILVSLIPQHVSTNRETAIKKLFHKQLNTFEKSVSKLKQAVSTGDEILIQRSFFESRLCFKRIEFFTEYFFKPIAAQFNGPAIQTADDLDPEVASPTPQGLQMIEQFLYPHYDIKSKKTVLDFISQLQNNIVQLKESQEFFPYTDEYVIDALMEEIYRIESIGLTGFDSPIANLSIAESEAALQTVNDLILMYDSLFAKNTPGRFSAVTKLLSESRAYLITNKNFNSFNRMFFITHYLDPLTKGIGLFKKVSGFKDNPSPIFYSSLLKNGSMFSKDAFTNAVFLDDNTINEKKIELGEKLFFETKLSSTNKRSCGVCHSPAKAFTDGLPTSLDIDEHSPLPRNAPTLWNSSLQRILFHDGRGLSMEALVMEVLSNKKEMNFSAQVGAEKIFDDPSYKELFQQSYPEAKREDAALHVCNAIACYVRTLLSFNSRFDLFMRGDTTQMNKNEINGFNLFMGKAKCGSCHFMPMFNGSKPPRYYFQETEVIGVPATTDTLHPVIDSDVGRYGYTHLAFHKFSFKTPTLRNIELTSPYMHNGVYKTLEEVLDFYNKGGGKGLHIAPENQTLPFDKLNLSTNEKSDIILFMKTLTDNHSTQ